VSVVLGHHPHVLQGIEEYQGGLIAYSLGNFVFDLREPVTLSTGVLVLDFDRDGLSNWEWRPAVIADDFLPDVLGGESRNAAQEKMRDLCAGIHACALPLAADLEIEERRLSRQSSLFTYRFFARNLHKYDPLLAMQSVARAFFRRVGLAHDP
jgi:poly-gamma-glutamate synthesis protein (capsule biosynthesis protein)